MWEEDWEGEDGDEDDIVNQVTDGSIEMLWFSLRDNKPTGSFSCHKIIHF